MARPAVSDWEDVFGFSDDPTPGDADMLGDLARQYRSVADNAGDALPLVSGLEDNQVGEGKTMDKLRDKLGDLANQVRKLHSSYDQAAGALDTYVNSLRDQQRNADNALEKGREAKDRLESATDVVKAAGADISHLDGAKHPPDDKEARASTRRALDEAHSKQSGAQARADDAQADLDAARMLAEDARQVREEDAATAAQKLDDARDESVAGYSLWDKIKKAFSKALAIISAVLGVLALLIPGLQGLGIALTIGAVVAGAASLGINMSIMAETGDWDIGEIVLGVVGLVAGGGALLKGIGGLGSALKGVKPLSMKSPQGGARINSRPANSRTCKTDPVDVASGEMLLQQDDLELPGVLPLVITRTHLSTYRYGQFFGPSWASTLDERLEVDDRGRVLWAREDGSILTYPGLPAAGSDEPVWPEEGPRLPLTAAEDATTGGVTYRISDPHTGLVCTFADHPGDDESDLYWLARWQDHNGNEVSVSRLADGTPTTLVHSGGYRVNVHCTAGLLTRLTVTTPEGPVEVASYSHDAEGNLTHVTNSSGKAMVFAYDDRSRITAWTDRNDSTYRYVYDDDNRVTETIGPDGYLSSRWSYDPDQHRTHFTDSCGATTVYQLNDLHQVIAETDPLGHTTASEWDRYDSLLARTDPLGNTTRYDWDARTGDLTAVHFPDGTSARTRYNGLHLPVETVLPGGESWRQEYDARGHRISVTAPDGATTRFTHDEHGAVTSVTDALGGVQRITNDAAGLPLAVTDPAQSTTAVTRDAFGRSTTLTDALGARTEMEWTVEGRLKRRTLPDGSAETWEWDGEGNCLTHTDPAGQVTTSEYTHFDRLTARTGPDGTHYRFAYDTELRPVRVLDPQGLSWDYTFDACGRLISESDFDDRTLTYTHDAGGRLSTHTTPLGQRIGYAHDAMGRTLSKDVDGVRTDYAYDAAGRLREAASPTSTVHLEWDVRGNLVAETVDGATTTYRYDALGRRTQRTTPTGACTELAYDAAGNRTGLTASGHTIGFAYDALGKELERSFGPHGDPVTFATAYDVVGRPVQQSLGKRNRALRARAYTYRADHHLTAVTDQLTGATRHYELDPGGRPLTVTAENWSESYAYDAAGNQTDAHWPDKAPHAEARGPRTYEGTRVLTAGRIRYEYDAAGRTVLRQQTRLSKKPATWRYTYDAEDHLTSCVTPDGTVWQYAYDPLGRRTTKQRLTDTGDVAEEVRFTWDGTRLAEQSDSLTRVTLTWDHDGHRPLAQTERRLDPDDQEEIDRRFFAIATDLVGTPTELVDEAGDIAWHSRAMLWGTTAWNRDATAYTPLRFPGQYADPETGLHYNLHRHYDPDTARFTTPDPLGLVPAPNPTTYVHNPLTWCDPLGLAPAAKSEDDLLKEELMALGKARLAHVQANLPEGAHLPKAYATGKDKTTGKIYYGHSETEKNLAKAVSDALPGESLKDGRHPGVCAEPRMFTNAINDGADPKNVDLVTQNLKGQKFKMCANCKTWVPGFGGKVLSG